MLLERSEVGKLVGMTGCLLSMLFILAIVITGATAPLQSLHNDGWGPWLEPPTQAALPPKGSRAGGQRRRVPAG
jgi:hypothetical protein